MNDKIKTCRRFRSLVTQAFIVVAITSLLLEGVGLILYFQKYGEIFYVRTDRIEITDGQENEKNQVLQTKRSCILSLVSHFAPSDIVPWIWEKGIYSCYTFPAGSRLAGA